MYVSAKRYLPDIYHKSLTYPLSCSLPFVLLTCLQPEAAYQMFGTFLQRSSLCFLRCWGGSTTAAVTTIIVHSGGGALLQMYTHTLGHTETETSAGHHHHCGNNTRDGYHKGKLWAPRPSWEDDLASPEQWTVGICLSCIDLPPMASPARLSERRADKKIHNIFLSPSWCLSFLSVRRAPTDQQGWSESWTTCWQDLLNSHQWHIV